MGKVDEAVKKGEAHFKLLYDKYTANISWVSPWHKRGEPYSEEMLAASIEEVDGVEHICSVRG